MKLNNIQGRTLNIILIAIALFFAILWLTKTKEVIIDNSVEVAELEYKLFLADSNYIVMKDIVDSKTNEIIKLKEENIKITNRINYHRYEADREVAIITNQSLKEDSLYFAVHSKEAIVLQSDTTVIITNMQLKYANINISTAQSCKTMNVLLSNKINNLDNQIAQQDTIIIEQSNQIELYKNASEASNKLLEIEQEKADALKKAERKKKWRNVFVGLGGGIIIGALTVGLAG